MDALLETWDINARLNHYLLEAIPDDCLPLKAEKGKTVGAQFCHMHNVRLMWLKVSAPELWEPLQKLEDKASRAEIEAGLLQSDAALRELLQRGFATGKIKGFKPHSEAFLGYIIAHEANHRAQLDLALRLLGRALPDKVHYGLWEWGVR